MQNLRNLQNKNKIHFDVSADTRFKTNSFQNLKIPQNSVFSEKNSADNIENII